MYTLLNKLKKLRFTEAEAAQAIGVWSVMLICVFLLFFG